MTPSKTEHELEELLRAARAERDAVAEDEQACHEEVVALLAERKRLLAARFVAEHWRDEAMKDPQDKIVWGAVAHACAMVLGALDGETDPASLGISESKHEAFRSLLAEQEATDEQR